MLLFMCISCCSNAYNICGAAPNIGSANIYEIIYFWQIVNGLVAIYNNMHADL